MTKKELELIESSYDPEHLQGVAKHLPSLVAEIKTLNEWLITLLNSDQLKDKIEILTKHWNSI